MDKPSPILEEYCRRNNIVYPPVSCSDVVGHDLTPGDKVYVARHTQCRGVVLDYGKIVKIDIPNQKVLIDWSNSPVETKDIHWDKRANGGKGGVVEWNRKKTWIWNRLCGLADS